MRIVLLLLLPAFICAAAAGDELSIERLTWAGVRMQANDTTVFIDAVGADLWDGNPPGGLVPLSADTRRRYALVTHAHNDHFDADALKNVLGERGYVIAHVSQATYIASRGLRVIPAATWQPVERGGLVFTPVPAVDGFGDDQVSWVIRFGQRRFLHAGDTLWHGKLELIAAQFAPFDTVFLPINGARVPGNAAIATRRSMTPQTAVDAAVQLDAGRLVPIHYGGSAPPDYVEVANPLDELARVAAGRGQRVVVLEPGERLLP